MQWRVGRPSTVDGGLLNTEDCCRYDTAGDEFGIWHAGWGATRCCISIDLTGSKGSTVFASGYNESAAAVEVRARKSSGSNANCTVWLYAGSDPPADPGATDDVLRLVYLDLSVSGPNPQNLSSAWKKIVTVPGFTAFSVLIGYLSAVSGGTDECGQSSTGPHLHMDAPESASKNESLKDGQAVTSTTWVYVF